jgi:hypothetical protein
LRKFDDNMSVIYWEIICAKILFYIIIDLGWYTSTLNIKQY